ncbi:hypothetical protein POCGH01_00101600 [Plasmodium ovale]|uniref:Uncharacterized protein n=1 Tax=Plasmodium ovale TaxID=36330 RepID=A0A1D3JC50_PLAOA|nr:hypothetical protein POCGH01_00101600 [Plasmodium ovale]
MNINSNKCTTQKPKDNIDGLFINHNEISKGVTNELIKCNHNDSKDNLFFNLFVFTLNTYKNNAISKCSVIIGIYKVFLLQVSLANGEVGQVEGSSVQVTSQQNKESTDSSFLNTIMDHLKSGFNCISGNNTSESSGCVQRIFLVLSLIGTLLSVIGAIFSLLYRFCSCFMCCRRIPRPRTINQGNNNNQQLDLMQMQMQMQQQQVCNALMGAALANKGKMNKGNKKSKKEKGNKKGGNEKKNRNSSNGRNKPRRKNTKDKEIYIGYQKDNE